MTPRSGSTFSATRQTKGTAVWKNWSTARTELRAAICDIIRQGIRGQKSYEFTRQHLLFLPYLEADREVHLLATTLYRDLRKKGITVPSTDVAIAAVAIHHDFPLSPATSTSRRTPANLAWSSLLGLLLL